jgi:hypothetical protein
VGVVAVTSAANHDRILFGQEWLKTKNTAEEVLIIGSSLAGANEVARNLVKEKRAAFGYHRLTWGQLASTLARPLLTAQGTVPLGGLGIQAVANRAIHKLSQVGALGRYANLTSAPGFGRSRYPIHYDYLSLIDVKINVFGRDRSNCIYVFETKHGASLAIEPAALNGVPRTGRTRS